MLTTNNGIKEVNLLRMILPRALYFWIHTQKLASVSTNGGDCSSNFADSDSGRANTPWQCAKSFDDQSFRIKQSVITQHFLLRFEQPNQACPQLGCLSDEAPCFAPSFSGVLKPGCIEVRVPPR